MSSRVLIPLDGFQGSEDVMDEAAGMAGEVEAVHLVWVDTSLPLSRARRGRRLEAAFYEGFQDSGADEYLAAFRRRLEERGIEVTTAVLTGDPVSLIVAAAKESGADLDPHRGEQLAGPVGQPRAGSGEFDVGRRGPNGWRVALPGLRAGEDWHFAQGVYLSGDSTGAAPARLRRRWAGGDRPLCRRRLLPVFPLSGRITRPGKESGIVLVGVGPRNGVVPIDSLAVGLEEPPQGRE